MSRKLKLKMNRAEKICINKEPHHTFRPICENWYVWTTDWHERTGWSVCGVNNRIIWTTCKIWFCLIFEYWGRSVRAKVVVCMPVRSIRRYHISTVAKIHKHFTTDSKEFLIDFINLFTKLPCLWKIKSTDYHNRHMKNKAYEKLAE